MLHTIFFSLLNSREMLTYLTLCWRVCHAHRSSDGADIPLTQVVPCACFFVLFVCVWGGGACGLLRACFVLRRQDESDGLDRKAKQQVLDSEFASMIEASGRPGGRAGRRPGCGDVRHSQQLTGIRVYLCSYSTFHTNCASALRSVLSLFAISKDPRLCA